MLPQMFIDKPYESQIKSEYRLLLQCVRQGMGTKAVTADCEKFVRSTISTCPNFQKTEECTMSKPLYSGQGYLNKSEALGLKIY